MFESLILALNASPFRVPVVERLADQFGFPINFLFGVRAGITGDETPRIVPPHLLGAEFIAGYDIASLIFRKEAMTPQERAQKAAQASIDAKAKRGPEYVNPATSNKPYTDLEVRYLKAVDEFKRRNHKKFLSNTDHLHILLGMGFMQSGLFA